MSNVEPAIPSDAEHRDIDLGRAADDLAELLDLSDAVMAGIPEDQAAASADATKPGLTAMIRNTGGGDE